MGVPIPSKGSEGPFLAAAVLSETLLLEADGLNSIIRILDKAVFSLPADLPEGEVLPFQTHLFISFRAGNYEGEANIGVRPISAGGAAGRTSVTPVLFQGQSVGPHSGTNLRVTLNLGLRHPGLYWFDILLNDDLVTRVPLQVVFESLESEELVEDIVLENVDVQ